MRCLRSLCFLFGFFLVSLFISFFALNDVSAVSQSVPLPAYGVTVCSSSTTLCSDYSFVRVSVSGQPSSVNSYLSVIADGFAFARLAFINNSSALNNDFYFPIPSGVSTLTLESSKTDSTLTYELLNSLGPDCPVCEECQVCPAIPENPYDDKFDKIITAIYVCAATILVVYFFYCIYRMIIKTTGGIQ